MKTATLKKDAFYESPESTVIEIDTDTLICTSPGGQTEGYDLGDTSGWYGNN